MLTNPVLVKDNEGSVAPLPEFPVLRRWKYNANLYIFYSLCSGMRVASAAEFRDQDLCKMQSNLIDCTDAGWQRVEGKVTFTVKG